MMTTTTTTVLLGVGNLTEADRESVWDEISDEVSALLQGEREMPSSSAVPFDAASPISMEQQRCVSTVGTLYCHYCGLAWWLSGCVNSAFHPSGVGKSSTGLAGWG